MKSHQTDENPLTGYSIAIKKNSTRARKFKFQDIFLYNLQLLA